MNKRLAGSLFAPGFCWVLRAAVLAMCFCPLFGGAAYASVSIGMEKLPQGLAQIQYEGDFAKPVKVLVEANGEKNVYSIRDNGECFVPLQMGEGEYTISVLQQIEGTKYRPLKSETFQVGKVDAGKMYTSPSLLVNFSGAMKAISGYAPIMDGKAQNDQIKGAYNELVKKYSYDFDKVKNLPNDYVPVIDDVYAAKRGICYDYSVLLASLLRHSGIPTKLVMGYAPGISEYHAWNEILINGKWVTVDTTYDSQYDKAKLEYTFEKDGSKRKVVKVY